MEKDFNLEVAAIVSARWDTASWTFEKAQRDSLCASSLAEFDIAHSVGIFCG